MAKPKKPTLKRMPKKPKASASLEAHKNYEKRAASVESDNKKRLAEYNKKLKEYNKIESEKKKIREKY